MHQLYKDAKIDIQYEAEKGIILPCLHDCDDIEDFVQGIKVYRTFFEKTAPKKIIWDSRGLVFPIPESLQQWVDEFLNMPAVASSASFKIGFVLGNDLMVQTSIMDVFENGQAGLRPRFFGNETTAMDWMMAKGKTVENTGSIPQLSVQDLSNTGKTEISLIVDNEEAQEYLYLLNRLLKHHKINRVLMERFFSLTLREKNICGFILQSYTNQQIAERLYIAIDTVKTHRKNIFRKLQCHDVAGLAKYSNLF